MVTIAFAEDHALVREAVADMIEGFGGYRVTCRARNGIDLIDQIAVAGAPDIALLDLSMPDMDGQETAAWLIKNHPKTAVLILTSHDSEAMLVPLVRLGIRGFMRKDIEKSEMRAALKEVMARGYYLGGDTGVRLFEFVRNNPNEYSPEMLLNEKEIEFIKLSCTDLTYKGIAEQMDLSPRAIDGIRDVVFEKLKVRTRVALSMFAMRNGLVL
jgi:two-component system invasion response regulator UvrY